MTFKKILPGIVLIGIVVGVVALAATVIGGSGKSKTAAPSYYTVKQASSALVTYVDGQISSKGAMVYSTKCASIKKSGTTYAAAPGNKTGLYGCIVDIRTTAAPTTNAECDSVVFSYKPGAAAVKMVGGTTVAATYCK